MRFPKKVILNNGGISDKDFIDEKNNTLKRYWIDLNNIASLI